MVCIYETVEPIYSFLTEVPSLIHSLIHSLHPQGVKRKIFVPLVESICEEEMQRMRKEKEERELKKRENAKALAALQHMRDITVCPYIYHTYIYHTYMF